MFKKLCFLYLNYMKFIQGQNRNQIALFPVSLDESIDPNNEVRIIDLFMDSLTVKEYGFRTDFPENGLPRRDRFYVLMVHGTSSFQAAAASAGLSSIKQRLAENVPPVHSAQNHRKRD